MLFFPPSGLRFGRGGQRKKWTLRDGNVKVRQEEIKKDNFKPEKPQVAEKPNSDWPQGGPICMNSHFENDLNSGSLKCEVRNHKNRYDFLDPTLQKVKIDRTKLGTPNKCNVLPRLRNNSFSTPFLLMILIY